MVGGTDDPLRRLKSILTAGMDKGQWLVLVNGTRFPRKLC
jgi:hypothetical protein